MDLEDKLDLKSRLRRNVMVEFLGVRLLCWWKLGVEVEEMELNWEGNEEKLKLMVLKMLWIDEKFGMG